MKISRQGQTHLGYLLVIVVIILLVAAVWSILSQAASRTRAELEARGLVVEVGNGGSGRGAEPVPELCPICNVQDVAYVASTPGDPYRYTVCQQQGGECILESTCPDGEVQVVYSCGDEDVICCLEVTS